MSQKILQKEPMSDLYRSRIEQEIKEVSSKVNSGLLKPEILKYLNLDLVSVFVYSVKGALEKDPEKPEGTSESYMVNGVSITGFATKDVEKAFSDCNYKEYVRVILAPTSLIALDLTIL